MSSLENESEHSNMYDTFGIIVTFHIIPIFIAILIICFAINIFFRRYYINIDRFPLITIDVFPQNNNV